MACEHHRDALLRVCPICLDAEFNRLTAERDQWRARAEAWKSAHSLAVHAIGSPAWQEALKEARAFDAGEEKL